MNKKIWIVLGIGILCIIAAFVWFKLKSESEAIEEEVKPAKKKPAAKVEIIIPDTELNKNPDDVDKLT
jgi:flagellar basal body-associated protein FliL